MKRIRPARAIGLAVRYSERLVAKQLGNKTFGTARHITTTLSSLLLASKVWRENGPELMLIKPRGRTLFCLFASISSQAAVVNS